MENQCLYDDSSTATISGNTISINSCSDDNTYGNYCKFHYSSTHLYSHIPYFQHGITWESFEIYIFFLWAMFADKPYHTNLTCVTSIPATSLGVAESNGDFLVLAFQAEDRTLFLCAVSSLKPIILTPDYYDASCNSPQIRSQFFFWGAQSSLHEHTHHPPKFSLIFQDDPFYNAEGTIVKARECIQTHSLCKISFTNSNYVTMESSVFFSDLMMSDV